MRSQSQSRVADGGKLSAATARTCSIGIDRRSKWRLACTPPPGHSLSAGISQPPREMAIPFKRCSLFFGAGTWMGFLSNFRFSFLATFAGALVAGLSGFAFGLVAASIWLYILSPLQTATLIIAFGLIVQGYSVWKLRRALDWQQALAVRARRGARRARRRRHPDLGQSCACAHRRRRLPGALQPLCAVSPSHRTGESRRRGGRRRCRIPQRRARRHHRAWPAFS